MYLCIDVCRIQRSGSTLLNPAFPKLTTLNTPNAPYSATSGPKYIREDRKGNQIGNSEI